MENSYKNLRGCKCERQEKERNIRMEYKERLEKVLKSKLNGKKLLLMLLMLLTMEQSPSLGTLQE